MANSIINSDDGSVSGISGLKTTGGDDGILKIQTNGTDAISVDASQNVTVAGSLTVTGGIAGDAYVMQTYTSPATWTKPAGLKAVKVTVVAGGGGGGGARGPSSPGSRFGGTGGGGGAAIRYIPAPSIPGPVAVTRGAGGTAGPAPSTQGATTSGGAGGTSSFGAFLSATGGAGAVGSPTLPGTPGDGGSGSSGDINLTGGTSRENGRNSVNNGTFLSIPNQSYTSVTGAGQSGTQYGGGATGAISGTVEPGFAGAVGAAGIIIVEEFY
jgi:hypothetical protein